MKCLLCNASEKNITLYRFPKEPCIRNHWLDFCNINEEQLTLKTAICEKHFTTQDLYPKTKKGITRKKKNAVPSIHIPVERTRKQSTAIRKCHFPSCPFRNDSERSFFKFPPKDSEVFTKWVEFCGIRKDWILASYCICSSHFSENDIIDRTDIGGKRTLRKNAVPVIRDNNPTSFDLLPTASSTSNSLRASVISEYCSVIITSPVACHTSQSHDIGDFQEHDSILPATPTTSNPPSSPTATDFHLPRYVGEIRTSHLSTPQRAKACIDMAKRVINEKNKKIKNLQRINGRLKTKLKTMKQLLRHRIGKNVI